MKMNITSRILLLAATVLVSAICLGSCEKPAVVDPTNTDNPGGGTDDPSNPGGDTPSSKPYFKGEIPSELVFARVSVEAVILVETNIKDWTATSDASWCHATVGPYALTISVDDNEENLSSHDYSVQPRSCTVTVKAGTVLNKTITVYQEALTIISTGLYGATVYLSPAGETKEMYITSNCYNWTVKSSASWLKAVRVDNNTLRLVSSPRPDTETALRTAEVEMISEYDMNVGETFTVSDSDPLISGDDYGYGDHTGWD